MAKIAAIIICSIICTVGCQQSGQVSPIPTVDPLNDYLSFAPARIKIIGLTEFVDDSKLKIYIDLIDTYGSRIKSPATFRFELYEHVKRSAEPKGKRIFLFPNINLTDAKANNNYWRDFLHAYEFTMDLESDLQAGRTYILQAICRTPSGTRLTATKHLTF